MDTASYEEATRARASYDDQKRRQIQAARDRVLLRVLELSGVDETPLMARRITARAPLPGTARRA